MHPSFPIAVFARLLYGSAAPHQVAFIWATVPFRTRMQYHKLLCHAFLEGQEYTATIVPAGTTYRWTHNATTGYAATFAEAWPHLPHWVTQPVRYTDTPAVEVPSFAVPTLETLWRVLPRATQIALAPANTPDHWRVS